MYVGCFVAVNPRIGAYRASSRPFPNRRVVDRDDVLTVGLTPDAPKTDNPYTAYNCVCEGGSYTVAGDGSQVDPIVEKLDLGYLPCDALAEILLALDYEEDNYDTPHIAGVVGNDEAYIGIVRRDALVVEAVTELTLMTTYEEGDLCMFDLDIETTADMVHELYGREFEHTVYAAVAAVSDAVETSFYNGE